MLALVLQPTQSFTLPNLRMGAAGAAPATASAAVAKDELVGRVRARRLCMPLHCTNSWCSLMMCHLHAMRACRT